MVCFVDMRINDSKQYFDTVRPRSFMALMDMYEQNYIRLRCLCPSLSTLENSIVSSLPGPAHDLHLMVLDRVRHTTTIQLTYVMSDGILRPDITVRVYHDSLQAEVLSRGCRVGGRIEIDHDVSDTALLCRWKLNRFLYKWLGYCLRQGHVFNHDGNNAVNTNNFTTKIQKKTINIS